jgi:hypothetical protein
MPLFVVFSNHKINLNITWSFSLFYHFWSFINRYTIMNNTSAVFSGTTLPSAFAMLQKVVDLLKGFVSSFITMFTLPYPLIQRFFTYWTFTGYVALNTNDLRTPFSSESHRKACSFILVENLTTLCLIRCL